MVGAGRHARKHARSTLQMRHRSVGVPEAEGRARLLSLVGGTTPGRVDRHGMAFAAPLAFAFPAGAAADLDLASAHILGSCENRHHFRSTMMYLRESRVVRECRGSVVDYKDWQLALGP